MKRRHVVDLFDAFGAAPLRVWLAGGWAVDAVVGRQTREHGDLDVAVDMVDLPALRALLGERGFVVTTDWTPSRLEFTAPDGLVVDVHPVTFHTDGSGSQAGLDGESFHYAAAGFTVGSIDGVTVPCLSVDQQPRFRTGYEPRPEDLHDMALLEDIRSQHAASAPLPRRRGTFERTGNHWWWRNGWSPGTRYLTWHLTFEGESALHRAAERAGRTLADVTGVDVVPPEWLHLTMTGVGFAADLDAEAIESHAESVFARAAVLPAQLLVFESVFLYEEGLCLSADSPWLHRLKVVQADLVRDIGGPVADPGDVFHPHVSLAYFSAEVDEGALHDALDEADLRPVTVRASHLSLIELGRDDRMYTWRVVAQRVLGG
ncbi:MAG: hypothetical protein RI885_624 [Actinomycetota bacterium]